MRYFFHLRGPGADVPDEEGVDLPSDSSARERAVESARGIMAADMLEGRLVLSQRIDIEDRQGHPVLTLGFAEAFTQS